MESDPGRKARPVTAGHAGLNLVASRNQARPQGFLTVLIIVAALIALWIGLCSI
jgi:hypothetical protein